MGLQKKCKLEFFRKEEKKSRIFFKEQKVQRTKKVEDFFRIAANSAF